MSFWKITMNEMIYRPALTAYMKTYFLAINVKCQISKMIFEHILVKWHISESVNKCVSVYRSKQVISI